MAQLYALIITSPGLTDSFTGNDDPDFHTIMLFSTLQLAQTAQQQYNAAVYNLNIHPITVDDLNSNINL